MRKYLISTLTMMLLLSACSSFKAEKAPEVDNSAPRVPISPFYKK